jgi:hypothetical protein
MVHDLWSCTITSRMWAKDLVLMATDSSSASAECLCSMVTAVLPITSAQNSRTACMVRSSTGSFASALALTAPLTGSSTATSWRQSAVSLTSLPHISAAMSGWVGSIIRAIVSEHSILDSTGKSRGDSCCSAGSDSAALLGPRVCHLWGSSLTWREMSQGFILWYWPVTVILTRYS